jgi:hypothetical protein
LLTTILFSCFRFHLFFCLTAKFSDDFYLHRIKAYARTMDSLGEH